MELINSSRKYITGQKTIRYKQDDLRVCLVEYLGDNPISLRRLGELMDVNPLTITKFLNNAVRISYMTHFKIKRFLEKVNPENKERLKITKIGV